MSVEPPMVKPPLSPPETPRLAKFREGFEQRLGIELKRTERMSVLSSRRLAQKIVEERADVSRTGAVYLDCREVEIVTPSFFDELLRLWPHVQPVGMNADVAVSWELAKEHAEQAGEGGR